MKLKFRIDPPMELRLFNQALFEGNRTNAIGYVEEAIQNILHERETQLNC